MRNPARDAAPAAVECTGLRCMSHAAKVFRHGSGSHICGLTYNLTSMWDVGRGMGGVSSVRAPACKARERKHVGMGEQRMRWVWLERDYESVTGCD